MFAEENQPTQPYDDENTLCQDFVNKCGLEDKTPEDPKYHIQIFQIPVPESNNTVVPITPKPKSGEDTSRFQNNQSENDNFILPRNQQSVSPNDNNKSYTPILESLIKLANIIIPLNENANNDELSRVNSKSQLITKKPYNCKNTTQTNKNKKNLLLQSKSPCRNSKEDVHQKQTKLTFSNMGEFLAVDCNTVTSKSGENSSNQKMEPDYETNYSAVNGNSRIIKLSKYDLQRCKTDQCINEDIFVAQLQDSGCITGQNIFVDHFNKDAVLNMRYDDGILRSRYPSLRPDGRISWPVIIERHLVVFLMDLQRQHFYMLDSEGHKYRDLQKRIGDSISNMVEYNFSMKFQYQGFIECPQQESGSNDCGIYVYHFTKQFLTENDRTRPFIPSIPHVMSIRGQMERVVLNFVAKYEEIRAKLAKIISRQIICLRGYPSRPNWNDEDSFTKEIIGGMSMYFGAKVSHT